MISKKRYIKFEFLIINNYVIFCLEKGVTIFIFDNNKLCYTLSKKRYKKFQLLIIINYTIFCLRENI